MKAIGFAVGEPLGWLDRQSDADRLEQRCPVRG
jgi:hypothetical protein